MLVNGLEILADELGCRGKRITFAHLLKNEAVKLHERTT
jgi:hypothetical protein